MRIREVSESLGIDEGQVRQSIYQQGYHRYVDKQTGLTVYVMSQTLQPRFDKEGNRLQRPDGTYVLQPPGHWNFIRMLGISGSIGADEKERSAVYLPFEYE